MNSQTRAKLSIAFLSSTAIFVAGHAMAQPSAESMDKQTPTATAETPVEWRSVEAAIGKKGTMQPGDVFKFGLPRTDLQVTANGVQIRPTFALGSWLGFKKMGTTAMVMGDLVLTPDEVVPVMTKLQQGGIEQTAIHNHLLNPSPSILYMHISGHGEPAKMAEAIHAALSLSKTPLGSPAGNVQPQKLDLNTPQIEQVLGYKGKANSGVYQFTIPRAEKILDEGMEVPASMGTGTVMNFQPTGEGKAAITGDFVLLGSEVNPVIRTLRENGIEVTGLHSHMLMEEPRTFYMHFWANEDAVKLARGLRAALDKTNVAKRN